MSNLYSEYEKQGKDWLGGKIYIEAFNGVNLNDKQWEFVNSKTRYSLISGGFASGKTTAFIVKLILLSLWFPGNRILLGRRSRTDVERATLPDFMDICPEGIYEHKVGPGKIVFGNGSEIIFFGLEALQAGAGQDIKKAEQAIKSLNLGAVFIDQLEEVEERVFEALSGRLRRNVGFQQMCFTTNPANFWAYDYFKVNPRKNTLLIETSMLDNKNNLTEDFIADQLSKGEKYVRRYVYGEWSPDSLVEGGVFSQETIKKQQFYVREPKREFDGIKIWEEPSANYEYQIGIDPSEGAVDPSVIKVICKETGEEVAMYKAFIPIAPLTEKAIQIAIMYSLKRKPLLVPEATGIGAALIEALKLTGYSHIYEREIFSQREKKTTKKLGFHTNYATKSQLIEHGKNLFDKGMLKLRSIACLEEMKTFIYSNEVAKRGAGAQSGYHDDEIMATLLACWNIQPTTARENILLGKLQGQNKKKVLQYQYE